MKVLTNTRYALILFAGYTIHTHAERAIETCDDLIAAVKATAHENITATIDPSVYIECEGGYKTLLIENELTVEASTDDGYITGVTLTNVRIEVTKSGFLTWEPDVHFQGDETVTLVRNSAQHTVVLMVPEVPRTQRSAQAVNSITANPSCLRRPQQQYSAPSRCNRSNRMHCTVRRCRVQQYIPSYFAWRENSGIDTRNRKTNILQCCSV